LFTDLLRIYTKEREPKDQNDNGPAGALFCQGRDVLCGPTVKKYATEYFAVLEFTCAIHTNIATSFIDKSRRQICQYLQSIHNIIHKIYKTYRGVVHNFCKFDITSPPANLIIRLRNLG